MNSVAKSGICFELSPWQRPLPGAWLEPLAGSNYKSFYTNCNSFFLQKILLIRSSYYPVPVTKKTVRNEADSLLVWPWIPGCQFIDPCYLSRWNTFFLPPSCSYCYSNPHRIVFHDFILRLLLQNLLVII